MFDHFRRATRRIARQLVPTTGRHRQQAPQPGPLDTPMNFGATRPLRLLRPPALPLRPDDHPLVRPYVLNAEEWARRREEVRPRVTANAS